VKGVAGRWSGPERARELGLRRTFQAAQLVRGIATSRNVMSVSLQQRAGLVRRAAFWPLLPRAVDGASMLGLRAGAPSVGAGTGSMLGSRRATGIEN